MLVLIYTGNGSHIPGVPARDLTQADIDKTPYNALQLAETACYTFVTIEDDTEDGEQWHTD